MFLIVVLLYGIMKRLFLRCVVIRLFQVITQTVNSLYKSHPNSPQMSYYPKNVKKHQIVWFLAVIF